MQSSSQHARSQAAELNSFLTSLQQYQPTFPEQVSRFYMERSGVNEDDPKIHKLVSLAVDRFMCEVLYEAMQINRLRNQGTRSRKRKASDDSDCIDSEDLQISLTQMRIYLRRAKHAKEE